MNKNIIPLISKDIIFYPLNSNDYFIHQTEYEHRIKISKELYNFLGLIDNSSSLETIIVKYNVKYNQNLTLEFAEDFLYNKLARYGIILSDKIKIIPNQKPNYLKLSFILIDTKKVKTVTKYLKYLFIPKLGLVLATLSLMTLAFCFYQFNNQIFYSTISRNEWFTFFILSITGITIHEFGHASAAAYFGSKHGGIGGGFYLFMPVYFADVTDIWKLTKHQRIIVNLAGMYFELVYVNVLISIGFLLNYKLLIVLSFIFSMSIIHSLNPFIRSDGYWVLSDAIEKPNLMSHGFLKIKQIFKTKKSWTNLDYFILLYGLISYIFILFFLYFVIIKNPNSIIYFPQNLKHFFENIFIYNGSFSVAELGKLLIPMLFFYLVFGILKNLFLKYISKNKKFKSFL